MIQINSSSTVFPTAGYSIEIVREYDNDPSETDIHIAVRGNDGDDYAYGSFTQQDAYWIILAIAEKARLESSQVDGCIEIKEPAPPLTPEQKRKREIAVEIFEADFDILDRLDRRAVDRIYQLETNAQVRTV